MRPNGSASFMYRWIAAEGQPVARDVRRQSARGRGRVYLARRSQGRHDTRAYREARPAHGDQKSIGMLTVGEYLDTSNYSPKSSKSISYCS